MENQQKKSKDSIDSTNLNIFKNIWYLTKGCYKNKPKKFFSHIFLITLSITTLILIRLQVYFIPSYFSNEINQFINFIIDFTCALYLSGMMIYIYWKSSPIKKDLVLSSLLIALIVFSIIIGLILIPIYYILHQIIIPELNINLSEFGTFFSAITSLFAFLAVLYTAYNAEKKNDERSKLVIEQAKEEAEENRLRAEKAEERLNKQEEESRNRYREDSERTIFFQLLDLHLKQLNSIIYKEKLNGIHSVDAINEAYDNYFLAYNIYEQVKFIKNHSKDVNIEDDDIYKLLCFNNSENKKAYMLLCSELKISNLVELIKEDNSIITILDTGEQTLYREKQNTYQKTLSIIEISEKIKEHNITIFYNWGLQIADCRTHDNRIGSLIADMKFISNMLFSLNRNILGQYFRSVFYLLKTSEDFINSDFYIKTFKSQLSSSELLLLLYNSFSTQSDKKARDLLIKYKIFNNLEGENFLFKIIKAKKKNDDNNDIIKDLFEKI